MRQHLTSGEWASHTNDDTGALFRKAWDNETIQMKVSNHVAGSQRLETHSCKAPLFLNVTLAMSYLRKSYLCDHQCLPTLQIIHACDVLHSPFFSP